MVDAAPDLAVIELGTNDCSGGTTVPTDLATFESDYHLILDTIRFMKPNAAIVMLGIWRERPASGPYDAVIARLASEYGAQFVSLETVSDDPAMYGPDGVTTFNGTSDSFHPNDAGHAAIAAAVETAIRCWQCSLTLDGGQRYTSSRTVNVQTVSLNRIAQVVASRWSFDATTWSDWAPMPAVTAVPLFTVPPA